MALNFTTTTNNLVNFGDGGGDFNNMGDTSVCMWIRPTSLELDRTFWTKGDNFTSGATFFRMSDSTGHLSVSRNYSGDDIFATANSNPCVVNEWCFVAFSIDPGSSSTGQHLYIGDLDTIAVEPTYVGRGGNPTGSHDDSAESMGVGNYVPAASWARFDGDIAWFGVWNRALTAGEIKTQQFRPHKTSGCVEFCHLGWFGNGATNQIDWSGNANNSIGVTNTTVVDHVPLGPYFGGDVGCKYTRRFRRRVIV